LAAGYRQRRYIDMKKIFIIFIFCYSVNSFSQTSTDRFCHAYPIIGWDSLTSLIQQPENYPEIAKRAGLTESISVIVTIDSTGRLKSVEPNHKPIVATDSLMNKIFIPVIDKLLRSVWWVPCKLGERPIMDMMSMTFNFYLFDPDNKNFNIVAPMVKIKGQF
jgi:hypothetical protein